jgi:hypothetical protein
MRFQLEILCFEKHRHHCKDSGKLVDKPMDGGFLMNENNNNYIQGGNDNMNANHYGKNWDDVKCDNKKHDNKHDNKPSYIPAAEKGLFAGIGVGTTVTLFTESPSLSQLTGIFQGLVKDDKVVYALILAGALFRIPVREVTSVFAG